jgi:thioredoxin-related protein
MGSSRAVFKSYASGMKALVLLAFLLLPAAGLAQSPPPNAIEVPRWFTETFLDFREDVRDAAKQGKRLLVYFGQDGCPYCRELLAVNFSQPAIVEKTRRHFVAVALNIWGDREVTWLDGKVMSEKDFARHLKVQFTPTVLLLDEKGGVVARLNGYYPPHRFEAALDYAVLRKERTHSFEQHMRRSVKEAASEKLHDEPFFIRPPYALVRKGKVRPLAVLFETPYCSACDEMHRVAFRRKDVLEQIERFDVVRLALNDTQPIETPFGQRTRADVWARQLRISYTPTLVMFDGQGREVFRVEAYVRPFHLASSLDYVASGAYKAEPSFQRYVQARADKLRDKGRPVELWK